MKFEVYLDKASEYRWRLRAVNGRVIAESGEGYRSEAHAVKMIKKIMATRNYSIKTPDGGVLIFAEGFV